MNENDSSFLPSVVADLPSPKRLRAGRSKTFPISPLALRENRLFHTFSVSGVFIPLWQRGIKGDFKIMLVKSPLPLFFKEGYKGTFVLLEPITEGLRFYGDSFNFFGF